MHRGRIDALCTPKKRPFLSSRLCYFSLIFTTRNGNEQEAATRAIDDRNAKEHEEISGNDQQLAVASMRTLFFLKNMIYQGKAACRLFSGDEAFGIVVTLIRWHVPQPGTIRSFIAAHACHRSAHREISRISRLANNHLMGQNRDKRSGNSRDNSL